jgi:hypothetical protein
MITAAILFLAKPLARLTGWDVTKAQRLVWVAVIVLALIVVAVMFNRACNWLGRAKITTPETVQKINDADELKRREALRDTVEAHADVVKTVDERNVISDVNVIERNRAVDAKVEAAAVEVRKIREEKGRPATQEEVECILTGNDCPQ